LQCLPPQNQPFACLNSYDVLPSEFLQGTSSPSLSFALQCSPLQPACSHRPIFYYALPPFNLLCFFRCIFISPSLLLSFQMTTIHMYWLIKLARCAPGTSDLFPPPAGVPYCSNDALSASADRCACVLQLTAIYIACMQQRVALILFTRGELHRANACVSLLRCEAC
jgi:hypothetical protein